ncbi:hypothetical protein [Candidatus Nitrospira bockiana]
MSSGMIFDYQLELEHRRQLIQRARTGDEAARSELFVEYGVVIRAGNEVDRPAARC